MVLMSHMMVPTSHIIVPTITLLGTLNFYLLFKFNIYIYNISHLIVPIEWVPYSQKECKYCRMTQVPKEI